MQDPEHPFTLQQLMVVKEEDIEVTDDDGEHCTIRIQFTPTVPHCTLAANIGLCIREKIRKEIPRICKATIDVDACCSTSSSSFPSFDPSADRSSTG